MEGIQGVDSDLEILLVLDSPQLQGLAPELIPYRDQVIQLSTKLESPSCSSCARNKVRRALVGVAREVASKIAASADLRRVLDALYTSAVQRQNQEATHDST